MKRFRQLIAVAFGTALLVAGPAPAQTATESTAHAAPVKVRHVTFPRLDQEPVMRLRPTDGSPMLNFGVRSDEKVSKATLKVRYAFSPVLIPGQSHIKVLLNDETVGVLPVKKENAGHQVTHALDIDPGLIREFNKLSLEFVAHYTTACEDPLHPSLWAEIHRGSELQLAMQSVKLDNDLAMLPKPFFDLQDPGLIELPYVFAAQPSYTTLRAAGITSSWFGKLAAWRGARFPAHLDQLPSGHAVVFATNTERPAFLAGMQPFAGPALSILTNPADGHSRLLLVSGRDGEDLRKAANAMVLGNAALSGTHVAITQSREELPRKAYDAPNWVRLDRPMKFGELVDSPQQLQVFGHIPPPVRISVRIPPDLFTWRSQGVPVEMKFRYTPPIRASESRLSMSINGELVQSVNLRASGRGGESARVILPLLDGGLLSDSRELLIPAFKLGARNQLDYNFTFGYFTKGACRDTQIENVRAMVDADSTIDFSGFPHYAQMPHLGYFSTAGFPFTKYADLAQTVVVMPEAMTPHDIEAMLTLLGRMGESTGYPATRVSVAGPQDDAALHDRDILLIGAVSRQALLDKWRDRLPAIIAGPLRTIRKPAGSFDGVYRVLGFSGAPATDRKPQEHVRGNGPLAALLGFVSPLSPGRSVIALTAMDPKEMTQALDSLRSEDTSKGMHGSVVLFHGGIVENIVAGKTYTLGALPFWTAVWYPLSEHPILMALMSVMAVLVFAFALWRTLRMVAQRRLRG